MVEGVGLSKRQPYGGRPHQSHCTCNNKLAEVQAENARLTAEVADWEERYTVLLARIVWKV